MKEVCAPAVGGSLDALWASEKGSGERHPSTPKLLEEVWEGANGDVKRVTSVDVVALVHLTGFATGASAPPLKLRIALPSGCSGFSEKTVVTWPVASFGKASPLIRTDTP